MLCSSPAATVNGYGRLLRPSSTAIQNLAVAPRVRWRLSAGNNINGSRSFWVIASAISDHPAAATTADGVSDTPRHDSTAQTDDFPRIRSNRPVRGDKRVAALTPQLAPSNTSNDWFRFLAKPHEYWDHRSRKAWQRRRQRARPWEEPPDFTHQHDASQALWLSSAPPYVNRLLSQSQPTPNTTAPYRLDINPADAMQLDAMVAALRLRNPANPQAVQDITAKNEGSIHAGGHAAVDRGWFRFVRHPEEYWDLRPRDRHESDMTESIGATRKEPHVFYSSSGSSNGNKGTLQRSSQFGRADFRHQKDVTDELRISDAPGWALAAIESCDSKVPRWPVSGKHLYSNAGAAAGSGSAAASPAQHEDVSAVSRQGSWPQATSDEGWQAKRLRHIQTGHDSSWFRLLARPWEYYDYRYSKKQRNYPDFNHQRDNTCHLWLKSAPPWVLEQIAAMDASPDKSRKPLRMLTPEEKARQHWKGFLADPSAWEDMRGVKQSGHHSERSPDFVLKRDRRYRLWIHAATTPPEVHKVLTILDAGGKVD